MSYLYYYCFMYFPVFNVVVRERIMSKNRKTSKLQTPSINKECSTLVRRSTGIRKRAVKNR